MTYCVALRLDRGLVFAADTRTSAGNDNVAVFRKLHFWRKAGERVVVLASAGNLAVTQSVISLINERLVDELAPDGESLFTVPSMYRAALLVGDALRTVRKRDAAALEESGSPFNANFILGGQIGPEVPRLFHVYPEGNFIESTGDTPYFQSASTSTASRSSIVWPRPACGWARPPSSLSCRSIPHYAPTYPWGCPLTC